MRWSALAVRVAFCLTLLAAPLAWAGEEDPHEHGGDFIVGVVFANPTGELEVEFDFDEVYELPEVEGVRYWSLVPNRVGLDRALEANVRHIATFLSASETHNKKNVNRTVRESLAGLERVIGAARAEGLTVRSYISTVFGCPYEGTVDIERTVRLAKALLAAGAHEIALGDTTGWLTRVWSSALCRRCSMRASTRTYSPCTSTIRVEPRW